MLYMLVLFLASPKNNISLRDDIGMVVSFGRYSSFIYYDVIKVQTVFQKLLSEIKKFFLIPFIPAILEVKNE